MAKRGIVREYTSDTERRLIAAIDHFFNSLGDRRGLWVTLNTRERDPEKAKVLLRRWAAAMRRKLGIWGVYCLEFNREQFAHYHLFLGLGLDHEKKTTNQVREAFAQAWHRILEEVGQTNHGSCYVKPINREDRERIKRYAAKAPECEEPDAEDEEPVDGFRRPHRERWQKQTPEAFRARGMHANWWGRVNGAAFGQMAVKRTETAFPANLDVSGRFDGLTVSPVKAEKTWRFRRRTPTEVAALALPRVVRLSTHDKVIPNPWD